MFARAADSEEQMQFDKKMIPNTITSVRIAGSIALLFTRPFSPIFFVVYTICGLSDVIDGTLARLMKCESDLGAKLDSVADLVFYAAMFMKIFPFLLEKLPLILWIGAIAVILIRICSYTVAAIKYHRFASIHSYANKLTGAAVFCIPYLSRFFPITAVCTFVLFIGLFATCEELFIHVFSGRYNPEVKSVFMLKK